ncbi:hypothetical protein ACIP2Y_44665 [Streptomyces sviceus]|uniref:hypothetical protein n=1 Tax=Streptomyces sviceus TaxID=285530 RepID=UPI00380EBDB8
MMLGVIHLPAARAECPDRALKRIFRRGGAVVFVDGALILARHRTGTGDRPNCSGERSMHGLHDLVLTDESGDLIRVLGALRGRTGNVTVARHDHLTAHLGGACIGTFADLGLLGLDDGPTTRWSPLAAAPPAADG